MARERPRGVWLYGVLAAIALAACGGGGPSRSAAPPSAAPPSAAASPAPTSPPASVAPTATVVPSSSGDLVGQADASCRDEMYRDPGSPTVVVLLEDLVTIVYAGPEGDFICQWLPWYGDSAVVQGGFDHLADRLTVESPMVRDGNSSFSSETGTYIWGAVRPEVDSVVIELAGPSKTIEATLADGYFLAVIGADVPCCLFTAVALDANGRELARAQ